MNTQMAVKTEEKDDQYITATIYYNALNPLDRTVTELQWLPDRNLAQYLDGLPDHVDWNVIVGATPILTTDWTTTYLNQLDYIHIYPVPHGGGGGKTVLRIVGMIAIAALAIYTGGAAAMLATGLETAALATATTMGAIVSLGVGIAVSVGGSMLLNALLPPPKEKLDSQNKKDGNTYGVDGPQNTSGEEYPVPIIYGKHRIGGNIINARIQNEGEFQYLYQMINLGEGPINTYSDILINDETLDKYKDVEIDFRNGSIGQPMGGWFYDTAVSGLSPNRDYTLKEEFIYQDTNVIDKFRVDIVFPMGLVKYDDEGEAGNRQVQLEIVYRPAGSQDAWTTLFNGFVKDKRRVAIRRSYESPVLNQGKYTVGVRRVSPKATSESVVDDVKLSDLVEIVLDDVCYSGTAWLGLRIKFSEQLSGVPTVTSLVYGRYVNTFDRSGGITGWTWTDNPAWIAVDILINQRVGGGISWSRIHWPAFVDWADYCSQMNFKFNGVFDSQSNIWDAIQDVLRVGHAQLTMVGTKISLVLEIPDEPSMMFGVGNIVEGTFENTWLPLNDRANEFEINYSDEADGYRQHMVKVIDYDALSRGEPQRVSSFTMRGVTSVTQAQYEAYFQMALNKYIRQSCSFEAPLEAIACLPGDLVYVQHDMPLWGDAGRTSEATQADTVVLDHNIRMTPLKNYHVLVMHPTMKLGYGTVQAIVGDSLYVTVVVDQVFGDRYSIAKRLRTIDGTIDVAISRVYWGQPNREIQIESGRSNQFYIGAVVEFWDTDVIEERSVINDNTATETNTLKVTPPFSINIDKYINFTFGETTKIKKPFRVKSIAGIGSTTRKLNCIEYNASVYDYPEDPRPTPNYSSIPESVGNVVFTGSEEELYRTGNVVRTRLVVYWDPPDTLYEAVSIFLSRNDGPFINQGILHGQPSSWQLEVTEGEHIQIKLQSWDGAGRASNWNNMPLFDYRVVGKWKPPADVKNFAVAKTFGGIVFTWVSNTELDVIGYSIRMGDVWENPEEIIVTNYAGNRFQTSKATGGTHRYMIKAIDSSGIESINAAFVVLSLPAPASVRNFDVIQSGYNLVFVWMANKEPDLAGYEIREGPNWASSQFIAQVTGTQYMMPNDVPGTRIFWIKAFDSSNIYSDYAAFSTPMIAPIDDRNVVYEQNENPTWSGFKYNFTVDQNKLLMNLGEKYAEYNVPINLPSSFIARTVVDDSFDAIMSDYFMTWAQATNITWASNRAWVPLGDVNSIVLEKSFTQAKAPSDNEIEAFPFSNFLTGVRNTHATQSKGVSYQQGRFRNGLFIKNTTFVDYTINTIPSSFSVYFWIRPSVKLDLNIVKFYSDDSHWLQLLYQLEDNSFVLVGSDQVEVIVNNLIWNMDDMLLVSISQTNTTRRLHIGNIVTSSSLSESKTAAPIAVFNKISFY